MKLIAITYHKKKYQPIINSQIDEIAGNFDSKLVNKQGRYSLHTEYSFAGRKFQSILLNGLDEIKKAHIKNIPELWKNDKWAEEFAEFIFRIVVGSKAPEIIEIHPPFKHYCKDFSEFLSVYGIFENKIKQVMPDTKIFIENRSGTLAGKRFLLSNCRDVLELFSLLNESKFELKMVIDYPQIFSGEKIPLDNLELDKIFEFNDNLKSYRHLVGGFHIWGKRKGARWVSHVGDLNSYFSNDVDKKQLFLFSILNTFDDGVARYFIPEVNSSEKDLHSIVNDMIAAGFIFIETR